MENPGIHICSFLLLCFLLFWGLFGAGGDSRVCASRVYFFLKDSERVLAESIMIAIVTKDTTVELVAQANTRKLFTIKGLPLHSREEVDSGLYWKELESETFRVAL
eukprot:2573169-Amphidinium_carterae.2